MRADVGGCICVRKTERGYEVPTILPECRYHAAAAADPTDHSIPWNCPTYYDGCNCNGGPYDEVDA